MLQGQQKIRMVKFRGLEKFHCFTVAFSTQFCDVFFVISVVVHGWPYVPTLKPVWPQCMPGFGHVVNNYFGTWQRKWCAVEVKIAMNLLVSRQCRLSPAFLQDVECEERLLEKSIP